MYKVGIIGCGFIGVEAPDNHAKAYRDCPDTELVACCDIDAEKLWHCPAKWKHQNHIELTQVHNLDIVSVCTPPETHCQIVCDISPFVRAIYCEKPIALTLEDADKMIETCHKHNVILQINHQRNFMRPTFRFSKGWLNTGTHMFALLQHYGINPMDVDIQPIETAEPIFELDFTHNKEPMILQGVKHLVECLNHRWQSKCSGEDGREALKLALIFKERYEGNR